VSTSESHVEIRPVAYADSVTPLQVSRTVQGIDGVLAAQIAMATPLNIDVLPGWALRCPPRRRRTT
jgi:FdrA protein